MVQLQKQSEIESTVIHSLKYIFELSKVLMIYHSYDNLTSKYGPDKYRLLYTDTDSYILEIETNDLQADTLADSNEYDTSNFPPDHPLYWKKIARCSINSHQKRGHKSSIEFLGPYLCIRGGGP
jgi:hypothetical protein